MAKARVLSLRQLKEKKYKFLEGVPEVVIESFGRLTYNFIILIYGDSGNGKSNMIIQLLKVLAKNGRCLYISAEEGHGYSMQELVNRHLEDEYSGVVLFADHTMTFDILKERLKRQRSEQFIFIDSVQYWNISYDNYKELKELFPNKAFIFISHAEGKGPKGSTAKSIEYDATIKIHVSGYIGFMRSRLGGNKPYLIWEEGAKRVHGEAKLRKILGLTKGKKVSKNETVKKGNEKDIVNQPQV